MEQTTVDGSPANKPVVQAIIDTAIKVMTQQEEAAKNAGKSRAGQDAQ